ncbi:hypothetical protein JW859_07985 [bacterium]|nr:hypothetical protein [bacterium]
MTTELQTAITGALLIGVLSILANVIRQAMWNHNDFRLARNESRLSFLKTQICDLYSPLLGYLHESAAYCDTLRQVIEQLRVAGGREQNIELKVEAIRDRFDREHFEPLRLKITELLLSRRHLIVEDRFPEYLERLISQATQWEASRTVLRELGQRYAAGEVCSGEWPREVITEVERTLLDLRMEYRQHLRTAGKLR